MKIQDQTPCIGTPLTLTDSKTARGKSGDIINTHKASRVFISISTLKNYFQIKAIHAKEKPECVCS